MQNTKGKLIFRKIENIQLCHFVSSVAQKRNLLTSLILAASRQTFQIHALKFQNGQATENGIFFGKFSSQEKVMLNFFLCVYIGSDKQMLKAKKKKNSFTDMTWTLKGKVF